MTTQSSITTLTLNTFRRLYNKYHTYIEGGTEEIAHGDSEFLMTIAGYLLCMPSDVLDTENREKISILQEFCGQEDRNGDWVLPNPNPMVLFSFVKQMKEEFTLDKWDREDPLPEQWNLINEIFYYCCFVEQFPGHGCPRPLVQMVLEQMKKVLNEEEELIARLGLDKWAYKMSKTLGKKDCLPMEFLELIMY